MSDDAAEAPVTADPAEDSTPAAAAEPPTPANAGEPSAAPTPAAAAAAEPATPPPKQPPALPPVTPASSSSPPNGAYKGPDFMQQHVHAAKARGPQQGVNSPPPQAYRGVKATMGTDTFMMQHIKESRSGGPAQGVNQAPTSSHQGVKATIGADSFMLDHLKKTKSAAAMGTSYRPFQGVKANVGADSFLNQEVQKAQNQVGTHGIKKRTLKPHVGADALMFDHAKKVSETSSGLTAAWNPIALFGKGGDASTNSPPKVGADAWAVTQMRVTKPQTPATTRPYQGVKANVGADSFHMAFLKSMSGWNSSKAKPREIML